MSGTRTTSRTSSSRCCCYCCYRCWKTWQSRTWSSSIPSRKTSMKTSRNSSSRTLSPPSPKRQLTDVSNHFGDKYPWDGVPRAREGERKIRFGDTTRAWSARRSGQDPHRRQKVPPLHSIETKRRVLSLFVYFISCLGGLDRRVRLEFGGALVLQGDEERLHGGEIVPALALALVQLNQFNDALPT